MKVSKTVLQAALLGTTLMASSCQLIKKTLDKAEDQQERLLNKNQEEGKGGNFNPDNCPTCGMG